MKSLAVRVLSDFGVDGIEPQALGSKKARPALQLPALAGGQAVSPGVLIDALWPGTPPARPDDQLAVLMSRLRSVLGRDRITHGDRGYVLRCDWIDAAELALLADEVEARREAGHPMGAVAAARVALSLIRGDGPQPLPGEWAQLRHAELERLVSRTRLVAATALLEAGDWLAPTACSARPCFTRPWSGYLAASRNGRRWSRCWVEHTAGTLHSLLFTGHAHALAGRPGQALEAFTRYTTEVERRQVPRFAGRAVNFAGWVLRNLGAWAQAQDHHQEALEAGQRQGTPDVTIAALEDLAEQQLETGDPDGAQARLDQAAALLHGDLVFGWRLQLKHRLITGRLALARGDAERALAEAGELESRATAVGVPRYTSVARLLAHRANHALGLPVDLDAVAADLDLLDRCVAIEAWRWSWDVAADFGNAAWRDRAADRTARLAREAGPYADALRREADRRAAVPFS